MAFANTNYLYPYKIDILFTRFKFPTYSAFIHVQTCSYVTVTYIFNLAATFVFFFSFIHIGPNQFVIQTSDFTYKCTFVICICSLLMAM